MSPRQHASPPARGPRALVCLTLAVTALVVPGAAVHAAAADGRPAAVGQSPSERLVPIIVTLRARVPGAAYAGRPRGLVRALRRTAGRSQAPLVSRLGRPARRLWLVNALSLRARP